MFVKRHRISVAENKTVISSDAEVCVLAVCLFLCFCPFKVSCLYIMSWKCLLLPYPHQQHFAADELHFCVSFPVSLFFSSSLQTIDFLNCNSMLPELNSHPEAALYRSSNAKLLNCQRGIKETWTLKKHPFLSLEYFPYSTEVPSTSVFSK